MSIQSRVMADLHNKEMDKWVRKLESIISSEHLTYYQKILGVKAVIATMKETRWEG